MWSVFRATPLEGREELAGEVEALFDQLASKDVVVRGTYDVSALRADADLMVWWHAPSADALQEAYGRLRRTKLGATLPRACPNLPFPRRPRSTRATFQAFSLARAQTGSAAGS